MMMMMMMMLVRFFEINMMINIVLPRGCCYIQCSEQQPGWEGTPWSVASKLYQMTTRPSNFISNATLSTKHWRIYCCPSLKPIKQYNLILPNGRDGPAEKAEFIVGITSGLTAKKPLYAPLTIQDYVYLYSLKSGSNNSHGAENG